MGYDTALSLITKDNDQYFILDFFLWSDYFYKIINDGLQCHYCNEGGLPWLGAIKIA